MHVSKDASKDTDKRLLEREQNQGRLAPARVGEALAELPDLSDRVVDADTGDGSALADELRVEKTARDQRIVRLLERALAPKPAPAPPPVPFEE